MPEPAMNPRVCELCHAEGLEIHWSSRQQAWTCGTCDHGSHITRSAAPAPTEGADDARREARPSNGEPLTAVTVKLSDVKREAVTWRWSGRLPVGKFVMLDGDPGIGKSWLTLAMATAMTLGLPLPGDTEHHPPKDVLVMTAEDGLGDTVEPRLEDMGANLSRVTALTAVRDEKGRERAPSLVDDLTIIEDELARSDYGLVILDPLNAYLGTEVDTHRDAPLRAVLGPLAALAERRHVSVVGIRHLTQSQRDRPIYRGQGGIAYAAAARVVLLAGINPANSSEGVLATLKCNLAPKAPSLTFSIVDGRFIWGTETDITPAALLAPDTPDEERITREDAESFLRELLADGPVAAKEALAEARAACISERTLNRAKAALGVKTEREGEAGRRGGGTWYWRLPGLTLPTTLIENLAALIPAESGERPPAMSGGNLNGEEGQWTL